MKKILLIVFVAVLMLSLTPLSALANSNDVFTEFSEKYDVALSKEWKITFSGQVTRDKINKVSIKKNNDLILSNFEITADKQITVSASNAYDSNSRYCLEIFLTNGNKYKMYFNTLNSTPTEDLTVELEVLRLVNIERSREGLAPLVLDGKLTQVAKLKSQDMADNNYFSHVSPTYGSPFDMMKQFGIKYRAAGENIARGHSSAEIVMTGWMNSPGHKKNILNSNFGTLGVGYIVKDGVAYWTQMFTN